MKLRKVTQVATASVCTLALSFTAVGVANAVDVSAITSATDSYVSVEDINDSLLNVPKDKVLEGVTLSLKQGEVLAKTEAYTASISEDPDKDLSIFFDRGSELSIDLPASAALQSATVLDNGKVVYEGVKNLATSVIPSESGVQIINTIANKNAPAVFEYAMDIPEGASLAQLPDGGVQITDKSGELLSLISSPWAYDANGNAVSTHYEINGNTLRQVVEHDKANVAYPVTADPIWLAPWVIRCLAGIGLNSTTITHIASNGSPAAIIAAGGYAALRCVLGR